jgi:uncharacterized membrane protein YcaP (DUF421 family)
MSEHFFDSWETLVRTAIVGGLAYIVLLCLLRTSGKRTLSKMNAFDFVVTVAIGSTLATILLNKEVALAEGALAFGVLIAMQYVVAWLSVRSKIVERCVKSEPALLLRHGEPLRNAMLKERVSHNELESAVRKAGFADFTEIEQVILETDGTFSVISRQSSGPAVTLDHSDG